MLRESEVLIAQDWYQQRGTEWTRNECLFLEVSQKHIEQKKELQKISQQTAQDKRQLFAQNLAMQALLLQGQQPERIELSILLAAEAMKRHPSFEADKALKRGLQLLPQSFKHIQRTDSYTKLVASADGVHMLAAGETGLLWIQQAYEETSLDNFHEFTQVQALALSSKGTSALVLDGKTQLHDVWIVDLSRVQPLRSLHHSEAVINIFSRDDEVITVTESGQIRCWCLADGVQQYHVSHANLTVASISVDECYLATASRDGTVKLWDLVRGTCLETIGHEQAVNLVAFHPERALLDTALQTLVVHPGGRLLASAEENGTVLLWDLTRTKPAPIAILPHPGTVHSLCFHPYKPYLATASQEGGVRLWQYGVSRQLTTVEYPGTIEEMGFYQREEIARLQVTLKESETAGRQIWTIAPGDVVPDVRAKSERESVIVSRGITESIFPASIWRELFSRNGVYKVARSETSIKLFQLQGKSFLPCASHHHSSALSAMAISPDGYYVALTDETHTLSIWDWRQQSLERLPWEYPQRIHHLIFCDEHSLLTVSEKNIIGCWDFHEEKARYLLPHNCPVNSLEMHPDGRSFLTISDDTLVRIWSSEKEERLSVLSHLARVQRALFSPTGRYIITISADFIVHVWAATTGRPLADLEHNGEVYYLALSTDESYIATASRDQHMRIWHWTSDALFEEARYHMNRNLTPEEWLQYLGNIPYEETFLLDWRADERTPNL